MSTVLSFVSGDTFILRLWKRLQAQPGMEWTNTYELKATSSGTLTDIQAAITAFKNFEQRLHLTLVEFTRATVSTWVPDSVPYNPESFYDEPIPTGTLGMVATPGNYLPLSMCWMIQRFAVTGRQGKAYYRGCMQEGDVIGAGERWAFDDPSIWTDRLNGAILGGPLANYFTSGAGPLKLAMIATPKGVTVPQIRLISTFISNTVSEVQVKHAWYNRENKAPQQP